MAPDLTTFALALFISVYMKIVNLYLIPDKVIELYPIQICHQCYETGDVFNNNNSIQRLPYFCTGLFLSIDYTRI